MIHPKPEHYRCIYTSSSFSFSLRHTGVTRHSVEMTFTVVRSATHPHTSTCPSLKFSVLSKTPPPSSTFASLCRTPHHSPLEHRKVSSATENRRRGPNQRKTRRRVTDGQNRDISIYIGNTQAGRTVWLNRTEQEKVEP